MSDTLSHYGTPRHSGRYPWGSGENPEQRNRSFIGYVDNLKKQGLSEKAIADHCDMSISQLRNKKTIAKAQIRSIDAAQALRLKDKGYSNVAIGERMGGINESSVRALLNPALKARSEMASVTADILRESINERKYIDIGVGVERHIGVSRTKLKAAISMLEEEGYTTHYIPVEQLGTGKKTSVMVLAKPDTPYTEVYQNKGNIKMPTGYTEDGGKSRLGLEPINSVASSRVKIIYGDEGGSDKDGVIELRKGVEDINLGNAKYAQVRIGVDGAHYMKGMAIYNDNMPEGIDILYNTNKATGTPKEKVFKEMKMEQGIVDQDNPFGATVRQKHYIDSKGNKKLSALNIINEEGEWREKWSTNISSQMLSKQTPALAKKQLGLAYDLKKEEFNDINALTNPAVKKRLLATFADECDSAAVHLKAAGLPRIGWHVLLPVPSMKETEIYAPNFRDGEKVVLIRFPHGGIFEIPELTVNNKNAAAKKVFDRAKDAVGINPKVAERLSGADFDGDAVLVIPNNNKEIKNSAPLKGLMNFDPKVSYPAYEGMTPIKSTTKQTLMGDVSNLVTDMTIKGANTDEIARAVRHSMVIIDAEKHNLNYKQSHIDNGIAGLKLKYQGKTNAGASTLISRASSQARPNERVEGQKIINPDTGKVRRVYIDPITGKKLYENTNDSYVDKKGKVVTRTIKSTKMAETDDAFTLSSGTPIETIYATHANKLKALGNEARKAYATTKDAKWEPSAKEAYAPEVASLNAKLNIALKNAPLERQAQLLANTVVNSKKDNNPEMVFADLKKIKGQALAEARSRTGAKKVSVDITTKEWEAIQAGAISNNTLTKILANTDLDKVKELATPRVNKGISPSKAAKAKQMINSGYTQAEVADALGVSTSTISKLIE